MPLFKRNKDNQETTEVVESEDYQEQVVRLKEQVQQMRLEHEAEVSYLNSVHSTETDTIRKENARLSLLQTKDTNANWESLVQGHTLTRGGSVVVHGTKMELWECTDGCNTNPQARLRLLLPEGLTP